MIWCTIDPLINHQARIHHVKVSAIELISKIDAEEADGTGEGP